MLGGSRSIYFAGNPVQLNAHALQQSVMQLGEDERRDERERALEI